MSVSNDCGKGWEENLPDHFYGFEQSQEFEYPQGFDHSDYLRVVVTPEESKD
jgi:hypothetical protein